MGNANDTGGEHYKHAHGTCPSCGGKIEHWDLYGPQPYLEGAATKYVTRWREKDGLDSIKKATHFIQKLVEQNFPDVEFSFTITQRGKGASKAAPPRRKRPK